MPFFNQYIVASWERCNAMPLLSRKSVLGAKIEGTIGTAEALAGTDGVFNVFNSKMTPNIDMEDREGQGGFNYLLSVPAGRAGTATFSTYAQWDGTATEPEWADTFLPACGWVKSSQVFTPRSEAPGSNVKTLTIGKYINGVLFTLAGCMGKFKVNMPTGKLVRFDWEFQGVWQGRTDTAIIAPTYPVVTNLRFAGGVSQWNNVDLTCSNAVIDSGNVLYMREDPNAGSEGYISCIVTGRKPMITIDPEAVTVAAQDRWGSWLSQTSYAMELHCAGPTTSLLQFDIPAAQIVGAQEGDRSGLATDELEFLCSKNGATHDQELSITFTAAV